MIPRSCLESLLTAVTSQLTTSGMTALATGGVHDGTAPEGTTPPYLVVMNPTENAWNTLGSPGGNCTFQLQVFSAAETDIPAIRILNKARQLLDRSALTLTSGFACASVHFENTAFGAEIIDGVEYRHATALYRAMVKQTS